MRLYSFIDSSVENSLFGIVLNVVQMGFVGASAAELFCRNFCFYGNRNFSDVPIRLIQSKVETQNERQKTPSFL